MTDKFSVVIDADLEDLIPGFLTNRNNEVERLKGLLADGDFENIARIAHDHKGVGAGYGFQQITDLGIEMELAAKQADADGVGAALEKLETYLANLDIRYE